MDDYAFSILIVTFNNAACILDLLGDIQAINPDYLDSTIIIDNYSSDTTTTLIQHQFPRTQLVTNPVNIGFGSAVNQGVRMIETPFFFSLNPDIRLPGNFFDAMMQTVHSNQIAAVGPLQQKVGRKKTYLNFCWSFLKLECFKVYLRKLIDPAAKYSNPIEVTYLNAGCLLINRSVFEKVGGFNQKYFLYGEEPDIFLKFKLYNYQCFLQPGVEIIHLRDQSMHTLPFTTHQKYRLNSVRNIADALVRGYFRILQSRLQKQLG